MDNGFGFPIGRSRPRSSREDAIQAQQKLTRSATAAFGIKDYHKAAELFGQAIQKGDRHSTTAYNLACALGLSGDKDGAFKELNHSIDLGFHDYRSASADADLAPLHEDPRWQAAIKRMREIDDKESKRLSDPTRVRIVTSDVQNFFKAYDQAMGKSVEEQIDIYGRLYYDKASPGLLDFETVRGFNPTNTVAAIKASPKFFEFFRHNPIPFDRARKEVIEAFSRFKAMAPYARFPDVYFSVGQISTGGTTGEHGLLIGAEMFARTDKMPVDDLGKWAKSAVMSENDIVPLIVHESVHYQQTPKPLVTLLDKVIQEGCADFVARLFAHRMTGRSEAVAAYGDAHEAELWEKFKSEMDGKDLKGWMYGNGWAEGVPSDLGYWMGAKICESFYSKQADKKQALNDLLSVTDSKTFLAKSGYDGPKR